MDFVFDSFSCLLYILQTDTDGFVRTCRVKIHVREGSQLTKSSLSIDKYYYSNHEDIDIQ